MWVLLAKICEEGGFYIREIFCIKEALLLVWLAVCMVFDFRDQEIPNVWIFCGILTAVFSVWIMGESGAEIWMFLMRFLVVAVLCFPMFFIRVLGAGDIKMLAVVIGVLGGQAGFFSCVVSFLISSICGAIKLIRKRNLKKRVFCASVYLMYGKKMGEIPYWNPEQDGYEMTMPLAWSMWSGVLIYLLQKHFHV